MLICDGGRLGLSLALLLLCIVVTQSLQHATINNRLQYALTLSKQSQSNITAAYAACDTWKGILLESSEQPTDLQTTIQSVGRALYAACLVRVGRDDLALQEYDRIIATDAGGVNINDAYRGKASCLQRLLRYNEAFKCFLQGFQKTKDIDYLYSAVTNMLRNGRPDEALQQVKGALGTTGDNTRLEALQIVLMYLQSILSFTVDNININSNNNTAIQTIQIALLSNEYGDSKISASESVLYRWILAILKKDDDDIEPVDVTRYYMDLVQFNSGPWDDPLLLQLDDKVKLHQLLIQSSDPVVHTLWPQGYIVGPHNKLLTEVVNDNETKLWILKKPTGYGSHGNTILKRSFVEQAVNELSEQCLLQKVVDPPFLYNGYKISLRIYVVILTGRADVVHISDHGLVKIAARLWNSSEDNDDDNKINSDMHMTNSGRGVEMKQLDLVALELYFDERKYDWKKCWKSIRDSVETTMRLYNNHVVSETRGDSSLAAYRQQLGKLCLPKILGFDYILDHDMTPWLIEVNRFPGMEYRNDQDQLTKVKVVTDAWNVALLHANTARN